MLHQDGYGTVDSGHTVLQGYNEVILLRRIPQDHKSKAISQFPELVEAGSTPEAVLYGLPHTNQRENSHKWATEETLDEYKDMK